MQHPDHLLDLGRQHLQLGNYSEALQHFEQALVLNSNCADAWNGRGAALKNLNRFQEALAAYDRAITIDSTSYKAWHNRGVVLEQMHCYLEAQECYQEALKIQPGFQPSVGNHQLLQQRFANFKVVSIPSQIQLSSSTAGTQSSMPTNIEIILMQGVEKYMARDWEGAIANFDQVIEQQPDSLEAWFNRAFVLSLSKSLEESLYSYDRALQISPNDETVWRRRGEVLAYLGNVAEARSSLERALQIKPGWFKLDSELIQLMK